MQKIIKIKQVLVETLFSILGALTLEKPRSYKEELKYYFKDSFDSQGITIYLLSFSVASLLAPSFYAITSDAPLLVNILGVISCGIAAIIYFLLFSYPFIMFSWISIHNLLPKKEERAAFIISAHRRSKMWALIQESNAGKITGAQGNKAFSEFLSTWKVDSLRGPLKEFFDKDTPGFVRLFSQSFFPYYKEYSSVPPRRHTNYNLIVLSMLIPRRKTLSADTIQKIITNLQSVNLNSSLGSMHLSIFNSIPNLTPKELVSNEKVSAAFINYSDEQIKDLFSRPMKYEDLTNIYKIALEPATEAFPLFKTSIADLAYFCENNCPITVNNQGLLNLPSQQGDLSFLVVKKSEERVKLGNDFFNCLRFNSYRGEDLVGIYRKGQPLACVSIYADGRIGQFQGPFNTEVFESDMKEILGVLKPLLN